MRNPLVWLVCVLALLALCGLVLWEDGAPPQLAAGDPIAEEAAPERRDPAELVTPRADPEPPRPAEDADVEPDAVESRPAPSAPERKAVPVDRELTLRGRIVDVETGEGVPGCAVSLTCGDWYDAWRSLVVLGSDDSNPFEGALRQTTSDEDGNFELTVLESAAAMACGLFVNGPEGWHVEGSPRDLPFTGMLAELEELFHAKRWPPPVAGDVAGWLRAESGGFPADALPRTNHLLLDLVSTEKPPIERRATLERVEDVDGVRFRFLFADVPEGEYRLTLSSLGNYRWEPTSLLVCPPMDGLEFVRFDRDEALPLAFEVVDAETREPIADFEARHIKQTSSEEHGVLLHTGPLEEEQFPRDQSFLWSVEADGYAVAYGDESAFTEEAGRRVARVALRRGWSTRFLVMGGKRNERASPLAGADVVLDGEVVGRTGPDGGLVVALDAQPAAVEVRYFGWSLGRAISLEKSRSNVTPVILVEPD